VSLSFFGLILCVAASVTLISQGSTGFRHATNLTRAEDDWMHELKKMFRAMAARQHQLFV
jgi:hypothetical protein